MGLMRRRRLRRHSSCNPHRSREGEKVLHFVYVYRVVQLNFTPEIEVFSMLFDRSLAVLEDISQTA